MTPTRSAVDCMANVRIQYGGWFGIRSRRLRCRNLQLRRMNLRLRHRNLRLRCRNLRLRCRSLWLRCRSLRWGWGSLPRRWGWKCSLSFASDPCHWERVRPRVSTYDGTDLHLYPPRNMASPQPISRRYYPNLPSVQR